MVGLFFLAVFFAHFVQWFPLDMLYNPLQVRFLSNFAGIYS